MATKTLRKKVQAKPATGKLATPVIEPVRDVFLAGLGAFALVRDEGARWLGEGGRLFDRFVTEGRKFEGRTRGLAGDTVEDLRENVESTVGTLRKQATEQLDRLEHTIGFSVSDTLNRLGIPSAGDLDDVTLRIQKMSRQVNENWKGLNKTIDARIKAVLGKADMPAADELNQLAERLQRFSRETVENLVAMENAFEKRLAGVLKSMDIPTRDEIQKLSESVAELGRNIAALDRPKPGTGKTGAAK